MHSLQVHSELSWVKVMHELISLPSGSCQSPSYLPIFVNSFLPKSNHPLPLLLLKEHCIHLSVIISQSGSLKAKLRKKLWVHKFNEGVAIIKNKESKPVHVGKRINEVWSSVGSRAPEKAQWVKVLAEKKRQPDLDTPNTCKIHHHAQLQSQHFCDKIRDRSKRIDTA